MGFATSDLFGAFLAEQSQNIPGDLAVVFGPSRWTYRELGDHVDACAKALIAAGIGIGDRVAILASPRPEVMVVYLACAKIGAILVGLNPVQQLDEYRHILSDSSPALLFGFGKTRGRNNSTILRQLGAEFSFARPLILLDDWMEGDAVYQRFLLPGKAVTEAHLRNRASQIKADDGALIVYTSGTTGKPKGAVLTQDNIAFSATLYCQLWPLDPLRVICDLPITHVACCVETIAYSVAAGGAVIFQEQFDAKEYLTAIQDERVSWSPLVPTMFQRITSLPDWQSYDTSSLQVILFGGAAMPGDMILGLKQLSRSAVGCWGMTETTSGVTFTDDDDSIDVLSSSIGRPARGVELALMDGDGALLSGDGPGEIVVRGRCVFKGYFGRDEATAETIDRDGWLHTGDVGQRDAAGRYYIVGRIKEMFKSGGYNVYPREVELAIESHPDVAMAVVVSIPDPTYQEVGYAFVLGNPGAALRPETIKAYCREKLANYKIPKQLEICADLPLLATGKIDRGALQRAATARQAAT